MFDDTIFALDSANLAHMSAYLDGISSEENTDFLASNTVVCCTRLGSLAHFKCFLSTVRLAYPKQIRADLIVLLVWNTNVASGTIGWCLFERDR